MDYRFPIITNIRDIENVIKDIPEIAIDDKGDYISVCYNYVKPDTFPLVVTKEDAIRRECRGLIFDGKNGDIIGRPFHKFFNVGEREETSFDYISNNIRNMDIDVKLDGSMVFPVLLHGDITWMTKKGITDVSLKAQEYWENLRYNYTPQIQHDLENYITPIFEFTSPYNQIVVNYHATRLNYLTCREIFTGKYPKDNDDLSYSDFKNDKSYYNFPSTSLDKLQEYINNIDNFEGVVLTQRNNGHMVKLKTDLYVQLHKIAHMFSSDRYIFKLWLNSDIDDIIGKVPDYMKCIIKDRVFKFNVLVDNLVDKVVDFHYNRGETTKKDFSINNEKSLFRSIVLKSWGYDYRDMVLRVVKKYINKQLGSNTKFNKLIDELEICIGEVK